MDEELPYEEYLDKLTSEFKKKYPRYTIEARTLYYMSKALLERATNCEYENMLRSMRILGETINELADKELSRVDTIKEMIAKSEKYSAEKKSEIKKRLEKEFEEFMDNYEKLEKAIGTKLMKEAAKRLVTNCGCIVKEEI